MSYLAKLINKHWCVVSLLLSLFVDYACGFILHLVTRFFLLLYEFVFKFLIVIDTCSKYLNLSV